MSKVLVVVDMQNDFVNGSLGTKEAEAIVSNVQEKIKQFTGEVVYTMDTHQDDYLNTQEGKKLPVMHCIEHTPGWELVPGIKELQEADHAPVFCKNTFGSVALGEYLKKKEKELEEVTFIGLCTDICVISNAMSAKMFLPEVPVIVDSACCAGATKQGHDTALRAMEACQIHIM